MNLSVTNISFICKTCNKEIDKKQWYRKPIYCNSICYNNDPNKKSGKPKDQSCWENRNCIQCGNEFEVRKKDKKTICSKECRLIWQKNHTLERIESTKKSFLKKYGVDSPFKLPEFQNKIKKIIHNMYGKSGPMGDIIHKKKFMDTINKKTKNEWSDIDKKRKKTKFEKYGDENFNNRKKFMETIVKKYGDFHFRLPEFLDKRRVTEKNNILKNIQNKYPDVTLLSDYTLSSDIHQFKCKKCGHIFESGFYNNGPICRVCHPTFFDNNLHIFIEKILVENNIQFLKSNKSLISPFEIDFYLPSHKIGIELNGNYWHSEINGKGRNYHLSKTKKSYNKGIKLIHIFEDEIINSPTIVESRLKSLLGISNKKIYGRLCEVKSLGNVAKSKFLNENHIQGDSKDSIKLGLFYDTELVSVMTFSKKRKIYKKNTTYNDTQSWELLRFCSKVNCVVIGGFSKLLKFFIENYTPKQIMTFADIRWSGYNPISTVYFKNKFSFTSHSDPNYWYVNKKNYLKRFHRYNFIKSKLLEEGFSKNLTEWEIMKLKGYDRIWDCGSMKFELFC